jgi:hypothetical protein
MVVIPAAGRKASVNQPSAQAIWFAWFFRNAFIWYGWLLVSVRNPREVKHPGERVRAILAVLPPWSNKGAAVFRHRYRMRHEKTCFFTFDNARAQHV